MDGEAVDTVNRLSLVSGPEFCNFGYLIISTYLDRVKSSAPWVNPRLYKTPILVYSYASPSIHRKAYTCLLDVQPHR